MTMGIKKNFVVKWITERRASQNGERKGGAARPFSPEGKEKNREKKKGGQGNNNDLYQVIW